MHSICSSTRRETGDHPYSAQHRCDGRKWCVTLASVERRTRKSDFLEVGVYSTGPIWGRIVDSRGPRILLAGAFLSLLIGYSGIRYLYNSGLPPDVSTLSILSFCVLVASSYLTGSGGNAGLISAVNSTAKTFPDQTVCWAHTRLSLSSCSFAHKKPYPSGHLPPV